MIDGPVGLNFGSALMEPRLRTNVFGSLAGCVILPHMALLRYLCRSHICGTGLSRSPQNRCALAAFGSLFLGASLFGVRQSRFSQSQFFTTTRIGLVTLLTVSTMDLQVRHCPACLAFPP